MIAPGSEPLFLCHSHFVSTDTHNPGGHSETLCHHSLLSGCQSPFCWGAACRVRYYNVMVTNVRDGKKTKVKPTPGLRERIEILGINPGVFLINKLLLSRNLTFILDSWVEVEKMSLRLFRQVGLDRILPIYDSNSVSTAMCHLPQTWKCSYQDRITLEYGFKDYCSIFLESSAIFLSSTRPNLWKFVL